MFHTWLGEPEVSYWIGREFWGMGVASKALSLFLSFVDTRPLSARVAKDNLASLRVLEKCGFVRSGEGSGYSHVRGEEVEEFILHLAS
jgi:RimJ/RimL family protein N-acetyltransferase